MQQSSAVQQASVERKRDRGSVTDLSCTLASSRTTLTSSSAPATPGTVQLAGVGAGWVVAVRRSRPWSSASGRCCGASTLSQIGTGHAPDLVELRHMRLHLLHPPTVLTMELRMSAQPIIRCGWRGSGVAKGEGV